MLIACVNVTGLVARGLTIGLAGAALAGWLLRSQLFGVGPWDIPSYAAALPGLATVAVLACVTPARRATATNPMEALRAD